MLNYIEKADIPFVPTGITKEKYIDIIETCLEAYPKDLILSMNPEEDIQAYSRIVCVYSLLTKEGRSGYNADFAYEIMTRCCKAIDCNKKDMKLDFSVKEIMIAYLLLDSIAPSEIKDNWRSLLSNIVPQKYYVYTTGDKHNINIYNVAGEWLRTQFDITSSTEYIEECLEKQLPKFDEYGMYPDNLAHDPRRNPILYDLTTRVQLQLLSLYNGKLKPELDKALERGGLTTLFMQSAAFELPYGGRSNQYLFNESLIASCCEYEAIRHKNKGNLKVAGAYKRAAHLAILSIERWLKAKKHIKNMFESDLIGTESYGYYSKYMITMASFMAIGYITIDDTITEQPCPAEIGGYVIETTDRFNKIFANCGGYSIEIDTDADLHYDATGLGRIHKRGIPTELFLSVPCPKNPSYTLPEGLSEGSLTAEVGYIDSNGEVKYLSSASNIEHELTVLEETSRKVKFQIEYYGDEIPSITQTYTLTDKGIKICAEIENANKVFYRVPLLITNGDLPNAFNTEITIGDGFAKCVADKYYAKTETDGYITKGKEKYGNRNGIYTYAQIEKTGNTLTLNISLGD